MAESAIDYVNLTRICEFARALHQFHQIEGDEVIDREFNAVCRGIPPWHRTGSRISGGTDAIRHDVSGCLTFMPTC
jgi:hypothetical protein